MVIVSEVRDQLGMISMFLFWSNCLVATCLMILLVADYVGTFEENIMYFNAPMTCAPSHDAVASPPKVPPPRQSAF
jgi:hypothetical protein